MYQLSPKQERFVAEYLIDLNATQAAIRAGYAKKAAKVQACRLLTNDNIKALIDKQREKLAEKTGISAQWVIDNLIEVSQRCMQKTPVMRFDKISGEYEQEIDSKTGQGVFEFNAAGATRALELIGKHFGMFSDKTEHSGEIVVYHTDMPDKPPDAGTE